MIQHLEGDCREILPTLAPGTAHCCITSPPYFGLRSYLPKDHPQRANELGQEMTPEQYVTNLVQVFRFVARALVNEGTLWLNIGDVHAKKKFIAPATAEAGPWRVQAGDLLGLPWRLALRLQADGWRLRSDTIWHKPNVKPESTKNRPTRAHEYLFLFSKKDDYHYDIDATREPVTSAGGASFGKQRHATTGTGAQCRKLRSSKERNHPLGKNKRSVWRIPVRSFPGAHFAVFPPELVKPCILAGCPKDGTILDPFGGSGTTGVVAESLDRNAILIELNPAYVEMQKTRAKLHDVLGYAAGRMKPKEEESMSLFPADL